MKHKRLLTWILVVAVALCATVCLTACVESAAPIKGSATVVAGENTFTVNFESAEFTSKNTAFDLLTYLADNENDFSFSCSFSGYGAFVNSVCALSPVGNQYVALFVNDVQYKDTSAYALADKTVNGETYYYSGVGISAVKLSDGLSILFSLETY